jgi:hypothetical protein
MSGPEGTMDLAFSIIGIIAAILLAAAVISAARGIFARGRLQGIEEAIYELARGVSAHYEQEGEPIPERVGKCIDEMKARVAKAGGAQAKCHAFKVHFWDLGNVMGEAAWQNGFEAGQRFTDPRESEIRVDLPLKELMNIRWLAHFGFENMVGNQDGPFTFKDEKDAEEATHAIERLEFYIPKERRDPSDPYALSFNRQTMIWNRWPSEKRAP